MIRREGSLRPASARAQAGVAARLAWLLSALMAPAIVATAATALIAWEFASGWRALASFALMFAFGSLFGMGLAYVRARRKGLTDLHIRERRDRPPFFGIGMAAAAAGFVVLWIAGAPLGVVVFMGAYAACLGLIAVVTLLTKPSVHCATMAAFTGALLIVEPLGAPFAAVGLVGLVWARVHRRRHTFFQCVLGIVIGAGIVAAAYAVWRSAGE
jgi:hypothetical protein